jgi:hypothetical protein
MGFVGSSPWGRSVDATSTVTPSVSHCVNKVSMAYELNYKKVTMIIQTLLRELIQNVTAATRLNVHFFVSLFAVYVNPCLLMSIRISP